VNTPRERDQAIEQWLQTSSRDNTPPTDACLDAETAAAWADDRLKGTALEQAQEHVADCARCQAMMASLTRAAFAAGWSGSDTPSMWQRWLGWSVPIATAAAAIIAIAVWMNVPGPNDRIAPNGDSTPATTTAAPSQPQGAPPSMQAPAPEASSQAERRNERAAAASGARERSSPQPLQKQQASRELADSASAASGAAAPGPPAAAPKSMTAGSTARDVEPPALSTQAAKAATAPASAPATQTLDRFAFDAANTIDIPSPAANVRWRVIGNAVEKSGDGGTTWTATPIGGAPVPILAGSAPSPLICWLVGRAGAILVTTDGARWSRPVFPERVDLVAVAATDAGTAVVTTADGRRFRTADSGRTWVLQEN
jgi:hypothetical protein